jgi:integrase/recombinase XerD
VNKELTQTDYIPTDRHPVWVYISRLPSPNSQRVMRTALETIAQIFGVSAEEFNWHHLAYQHVQAIRAKLIQVYAPATVNRHLSALRGVLKETWRLGYIDAETYRRLVDFRNIKHQQELTGRMLSDEEVIAILQTCIGNGPRGVRDRAIIGLLWGAGLRRSEIVALDLSDFTSDSGRLHVRKGKGRKDRVLFVANRMLQYLQRWIELRGQFKGALFTSVNSEMRRLTDGAIYYMLTKRAKIAAITAISPHDLRRTFISKQLSAGTDLVTVADIVGHADTNTTRRYDRRGEERKAEAAARLDLPDVPEE